MRMSDTFTLPLQGRYTATLWQSDAKAIEHAVNHHDALVEALTGLVESLEPLDSFDAGLLLTASVLLDEVRKNDK